VFVQSSAGHLSYPRTSVQTTSVLHTFHQHTDATTATRQFNTRRVISHEAQHISHWVNQQAVHWITANTHSLQQGHMTHCQQNQRTSPTMWSGIWVRRDSTGHILRGLTVDWSVKPFAMYTDPPSSGLTHHLCALRRPEF
jgi:hypothetical protein